MRLKGRKAQHFGMRCRESFIALWGERRVVLLYKIEYTSLIVYAAYVGMSVVKNYVLRWSRAELRSTRTRLTYMHIQL
jgi:hypothetical protein